VQEIGIGLVPGFTTLELHPLAPRYLDRHLT
jgi:hypothetical protein